MPSRTAGRAVVKEREGVQKYTERTSRSSVMAERETSGPGRTREYGEDPRKERITPLTAATSSAWPIPMEYATRRAGWAT